MIPQPDRQTELHTTEQPSTTEGKPDDRQDRAGDSRLLRLTQDSGVTRQREEHLEPLMSGTESYKTDSQRIDMTDNNDTVAHSRQLTAGNQLENKTDDKLLAESFEDSDHTDQSYLDSQEYNQLPEDSSDDETDQEALDHIAEILGERDCHTAGEGFTYAKLCKVHNIPHEMHDAYYSWLMTLKTDNSMRFSQDTIPRTGPRDAKGGYIEPGLKIPPPYGRRWREILEQRNLKRSKFNKLRVTQANCAIIQSVNNIYTAIRNIQSITNEYEEAPQTIEAHKAKKRKQSAVAAGSAGSKEPPASIRQAITQEDREEAFKWLESINKEWNGLCDLGVLKHDLTRDELRQMGIRTNPIDFGICLTYKFSDIGEINRYKTRFAIAGHPGNLQKGIHYDKTYASTPNQNSTKLLQAIMVKYRMRRLAFDIFMAYANAELPEKEFIAVRYPAGFKRYRTVNGKKEELFMALIKNLYGLPQAGRHWEKTRNREVLKMFSTKPWTIKQCIKEPCLFYITRQTASGVERVFAIIHTDDADMIGDNDEVLQAVYDRICTTWTCKRVDPSFMLGIKRTISETPDEMTVTCTMQAFVEGAAAAFQTHLLKRRVETPLPPGTFLHKPHKDDQTSAKQYLDLGYQRLFGMLLWAARGVYPECLEGTSMLGRLITSPTKEAWKCLCWMLTYMLQRKTRGIRFSSKASGVLIAFADASNKPDPTDGKCQYGYNIQVQGGPVVAVSKKANHVGQSAAHNEYMALCMAARHIA